MQLFLKMPQRLLFRMALLALLTVLEACRSATDLGNPCVLVKKNPDGGSTPVSIKERELPDGGKDFISFGAAICENLVCVRAPASPKPPPPSAAAWASAPGAGGANSGPCAPPIP